MSKKADLKTIKLHNIVPCEDQDDDSKILIFEHLPPRKQDLLRRAKSVQKEIGYAFCWVKNSQILLRQDSESRIIKINNLADLERLNPSTAQSSNGWVFPSQQQMFFEYPDANFSGKSMLTRTGRGRGGYNTRNRAASSQS